VSFLHGPITDIREVSLYLGDEDSFRLKEGERSNFSILILTFDPSILFKPHLTTWQDLFGQDFHVPLLFPAHGGWLFHLP